MIRKPRSPVGAVRSVAAGLLTATRARRAALPVMHPGRVDVIGGGAIVCSVLAEEFERRGAVSSLTVSEHDILDGIAMSIKI